MPPKKINTTVKKTVQVKPTRRQPKKEKRVPGTQIEKNTKNPQLNSTSVVVKDDQNKEKVVILSKNDIKIMLANEGRQFPKKSTLLKEPMPVLIDVSKQSKTKPVLKRKRTLKKNLIQNGETVAGEEPAEKKVRQRVLPKKFKNSLITVQKCVLPKNANESVPASVPKNETRRVIKKISPKKDTVENDTVVKNLETPKPKQRRKLCLNRKTLTCAPKTRKKINETLKTTEPENAVDSTKPETKTIDTNIAKEQNVILRRISLASLSELSWTKDISSSSSTTCVTVSSKDIVCIDNKLPIIKLTNIDRKLKAEENNNCVSDKLKPTETIDVHLDNSLCENSAIDSVDTLDGGNCDDEIDVPITNCVINLSSTTSTSTDLNKSALNLPTSKPNDKLSSTLEKLSSKLKNFDLEIINWIGYSNEVRPNVENVQHNVFKDKFLKEEMDVIVQCEGIQRILSEGSHEKEVTDNDATDDKELNNSENVDLNPNSFIENEPDNSYEENHYRERTSDSIPHNESRDTDKPINKSLDSNVYDEDEDDALSLYAESITGIESSTKGEVEKSRVDEFTPSVLPNKKTVPPEIISYNPKKVIENIQFENSEDEAVSNVCEKQNADSTSVYREPEILQGNVVFEDRLGDLENVTKPQASVTKLIQKTPLLMASIYKPIIGTASAVFKRVCFFNLISKCKKYNCAYPHILIDVEDVKRNLKLLDDTTFVQEYMLLRSWPGLRWKYGMVFVDECIDRELTRIAVEIAIDFIMNVTNKITTITVVENILLYLNKVDLSVCEDLLKFNLQSKNMLLCDFFIVAIAESQNFSRFKSVFINLTDFMFRIGRTFSGHVAEHVLERVAILPYDDGLARALMQIIRNTDKTIFSNSMIGNLEQQLLSANVELYNEFRSMKDKVIPAQSLLGDYPHSSQNSEVDRSSANLDTDKRYSPDTTNLDNLNKTTIEPKFTRTIDLNKLNFLNVRHTISAPSDTSDDKRRTPTNRFKNWRGRKPYDSARQLQRNQLMHPPVRPPPAYKRRSDQAFGGNPSKYQRRNGQNFFNDFS